VLVRVLQPDDLWTSVRWDVIFLLAGMIPMGQALVNTGLADMTGSWVANVSTNLPPIGIIGIFYAASMLLTMFISNAGTVILMVPIAFSTAEALTMSPTALVVAIMFAASNEFVTPVGYQTNLMVYGPGGYRFSDYARAGALLAVILAIVTSAAIVHWIPM
jgi:di/tricarboxylate transporter